MSWKRRDEAVDLVIPQGSSWSYTFEPVQDHRGNLVDLDGDGYTVRSQVRRRPSASGVLYTWDSTTANCVLSSEGEVTFTIEAVESTAFDWHKAVYDVELTGPDGERTRLAAGTVIVTREITRGTS